MAIASAYEQSITREGQSALRWINRHDGIAVNFRAGLTQVNGCRRQLCITDVWNSAKSTARRPIRVLESCRGATPWTAGRNNGWYIVAAVVAVLAIQQWWITSQQVATTPYSEFDEFRPAVAAAARITIRAATVEYARLQTERDMRCETIRLENGSKSKDAVSTAISIRSDTKVMSR